MDDFDNDGLLDLVVTSFDSTQPTSYYHNQADSTFEDRSVQAGVTNQLGGLVCYQADFDNDGWKDVFIARGAWLPYPVRPTLLRSDRSGGFADVTTETGLFDPVNSNAAAWADYDNDGWIDLFVGCEKQPNRLYHNKGDGTFEQVAARVGLQSDPKRFCKGCTWIDYDNDGFPDLFVNNMQDTGRLYHNNRDGRFSEVTTSMGIDGPAQGFACWTWDFDNDGWLDIYAASGERSLDKVIKGILGQSDGANTGRLYRNVNGTRFEDKTHEAGLDQVFEPDGVQFSVILDNDGWLDIYLGTGDPNLETLVPNRMFKNVAGKRLRRHHRSIRHWPPAERATALLAATGIATATLTSSSRPGAPATATSITTSFLKTRVRGTTGCRSSLFVARPIAPRHRCAKNQVSYRGRKADNDSSSRFVGKQFRRQPAPANNRPGTGHARRRARDPVANKRDDTGLSRYRRRSGHRGNGIREVGAPAGLESRIPEPH